MRISDWSSDVCSSDLTAVGFNALATGQNSAAFGQNAQATGPAAVAVGGNAVDENGDPLITSGGVPVDTGATSAGVGGTAIGASAKDRKRGVAGKSVSVRVDSGGRRIIKKTRHNHSSKKKSKLH